MMAGMPGGMGGMGGRMGGVGGMGGMGGGMGAMRAGMGGMGGMGGGMGGMGGGMGGMGGGMGGMGGGVGGMGGMGRGRTDAKDRLNYISTGQLIVVASPEGNTVTAYSTETGKAKSLRLTQGNDTKLKVVPILSNGLAALYLKGPKITRLAAFSLLDGTWYSQDLREPAQEAVPIVQGNLAAYSLGRRLYAFSSLANRWDLLELPEGAVATPIVGEDAITCEHEAHLYVFSRKTGRWEDIDTRAVPTAHDDESGTKK